MSAPGLFSEPERADVPGEIPWHWTGAQLEAGLVSSARIGDWEAVHRVVCALVERQMLGRHGPILFMLCVVLDVHQPARIYRNCGHYHEVDDFDDLPEGLFWLNEDDVVCEAGYLFTACVSCCRGEGGEYVQACMEDHEHTKACPESWPCPTFRPMVEKLLEDLAVRR